LISNQTLKAGIAAVRCYWQKPQRNLSFMGGAVNPISSANIVNNGHDDSNGQNIRPIAQVLTQLCVGSIQSSSVSPQDALLALEGILDLGEQHQIFVVGWFQSDCWQSLFLPCLRVSCL
jgi:hypothetical protein